MGEDFQSDGALMSRVCAGDAVAFETLYARHQASVRQTVAGIIREPHATEDLTQEVFLQVWTRADQWNERGAFRGWLLRIATNLALNHLRSVRRRRELPLEPPSETLPGEGSAPSPDWMIDHLTLGPERALELTAQKERLQRLLEGLPDDKREVIWMIYEAEMEVREVAQKLGIPEGTVRSRLHYARKLLARGWEED